jgi:hypothetical protein
LFIFFGHEDFLSRNRIRIEFVFGWKENKITLGRGQAEKTEEEILGWEFKG